MKKLAVISLTLLLVGVWVLPADAIEHVFGGYWRVRAYNANNFSGDDSGAQDVQQTDTRAACTIRPISTTISNLSPSSKSIWPPHINCRNI